MPETGTEIVANDSQRALSPQQEAFVEARLRGASTEEALEKAGIPSTDWLRIISDSNVMLAFERGIKALAENYSVDAINHLNNIARTGTAQDRARSEAARAVLSIAGHVAPMRERHKAKTANLADMDGEALRALVDQLQGELAARARPVNEPNKASSSGKALPFLD